MKATGSRTYSISKREVLHVIVFVTVMLSISMQSVNALADSPVPHDYRVSAATDKFEDTMQFAFAWRLRPPRRLKARYLEYAAGVISTASENRPVVSLGPVRQLPLASRNPDLDMIGLNLGHSFTNQRPIEQEK